MSRFQWFVAVTLGLGLGLACIALVNILVSDVPAGRRIAPKTWPTQARMMVGLR